MIKRENIPLLAKYSLILTFNKSTEAPFYLFSLIVLTAGNRKKA